HELNKGIVIQSGNDACIALADYVAGSQDSFIGLMNNYVKASREGLAEDELKNHILRLIRQGSQTLIKEPEKDKTQATALWS
ncbi:ParB family protein, partial [Pantoea agglomerans]|uniref:ParB family protein n=1 Tax=Enterobacter agglomerans TaxID=549 RepID=UPI0023DFCB3C